MIELPDDELDKLFRKSSEEFDPIFEPEDWNALKKRLDREDGKTPAGWLRKWWPVGILILLIPAGWGGYYLLNDVNSEKKNSVQVSNIKAESDKDFKKNEISLESDDVKKSDLSKSNSVGKVEDESLHLSENVVENKDKKSVEPDRKNTEPAGVNGITGSKILPRSRSKAGGVFLEPNRSKGKEGDGAFSSDKNISSKPDALKPAEKAQPEFGKRNTVTEAISEDQKIKKASGSEIVLKENTEMDNGGKAFANAALPAVNSEKTNVEQVRSLPSVNPLTHLPFNQKIFVSFPAVEVMESPEPPRQEKALDLSPKLAVRVGYSPDLSSVGFNNFTKPGSSFSLMAEYGLSRKLYVQAGVGRSEKIYYANASEYEWPGEWKKGPKASSTDATCKIIEIPLNLRYDLIQKNRFRVFAGAGASSYFMQKENYVYNYPPHTYNIIWKDYEAKTGWFWLSHINASAGYEYRISNKLSMLAEPYVKIPVKKVGYGKVDLFTAGMWISLRYTPVFFK